MPRIAGRARIITTLCLLSLPATAQSLRGQWRIDVPSNPKYVGMVLVDAEGRATMDSPEDAGRPAQYRGYVVPSQTGIKIALTNGRDVAFLYCATETAVRLQCYSARDDGSKSVSFLMTRVGPGPANLMQAHQ